jgi:protein-disulfide isomerase
VRYVFREFPRDEIDVAGSMLARGIAKNDCGKYFAIVDILFRQQNDFLKKPTETLKRVGKQAGLSQQAFEDCVKDEALLDKLKADREFASKVLKIPGTPTFFINGEMFPGEISFEEFDKKVKPLLKS